MFVVFFVLSCVCFVLRFVICFVLFSFAFVSYRFWFRLVFSFAVGPSSSVSVFFAGAQLTHRLQLALNDIQQNHHTHTHTHVEPLLCPPLTLRFHRAYRVAFQVEVLEYPELGMEAVWKIDVVDFPAFIVVDSKGEGDIANVRTRTQGSVGALLFSCRGC